jgi:hypothetical protein
MIRAGILRGLVAGGMLLLSAWAVAGTTAKEQVEQFYAWYMARIVADDPPLLDKDFGDLGKYVSAGRLARIKRQMNSADGMSADYFMQSQDYLETWPTHIAVTLVRDEPKRPQLKVVMGVGTQAQNLAVRLVMERGAWKVDEVGAWGK